MGESLWRRVEAADADLYATLGVSPGATDTDIQRAWRSRARVTHPDTGGSPDEFEQVHLAYLVLSEPAERARYDAMRTATPRPTSPAAGTHEPQPRPRTDLTRPREPLPIRFLLILAVVIVVAVGLSYVWPGFTLVTGVTVGAFVLIRYHRAWRAR